MTRYLPGRSELLRISSGSTAPGTERLGRDIQALMRTHAHVVRADDAQVRAVVDEHRGLSAEEL